MPSSEPRMSGLCRAVQRDPSQAASRGSVPTLGTGWSPAAMQALAAAQLTAGSAAWLPGLGVVSMAHVLPFQPRPNVAWAMSPTAYQPTAWQLRFGVAVHPMAVSP